MYSGGLLCDIAPRDWIIRPLDASRITVYGNLLARQAATNVYSLPRRRQIVAGMYELESRRSVEGCWNCSATYEVVDDLTPISDGMGRNGR